MTISELREILSKFPDDANIYLSHTDFGQVGIMRKDIELNIRPLPEDVEVGPLEWDVIINCPE